VPFNNEKRASILAVQNERAPRHRIKRALPSPIQYWTSPTSDFRNLSMNK
jgi:hypothetical protein